MSKVKKPSQLYATISISIVLILICLFLMLFFHTSNITGLVKERINILTELNEKVPAAEMEELKLTISKIEGVIPSSVEYITKEQALEFMSKELVAISEKIENPFRDLIKFNMSASHYNEKNLERIKEKLELEKSISGVYFESESIEDVKSNIQKISYVLFGLTLVFTVLVLIIIHTTVRLNLYNDLKEIKTMQMVGAEKFFIKKPYLQSAVRMTFTAFIVLGIFALILMTYVYTGDSFLTEIISWPYVILSVVVSLVVCFLIIIFSTNSIVNRFLQNEIN
ncbi:MAG: hypothetical protein IPM42_17475 [Saprospiraceae bacterium]|nr:hypothetical protein [Saprospiraceae bacterium]